jgi:thioredoxin 1
MTKEEHVVHVTDSSFEDDVIKSDKPTLVDFWAPWCGPCLAMSPLVDEIAHDYKDKARVAKINVDENPASAARYGIRGIPTLLLFKNGKLEDTLVGLASKDRLEAFLKKAL